MSGWPVTAAGCGSVGGPGPSLWRWGEGPASALAFGGLDHVGWLLRRRNLLGMITVVCISISEKH